MISIKVSGLLEEIGTLYEDGTLILENVALVKDDCVVISEDIIRRLDSGKIMCGKNPCKKIKMTLNKSIHETTTAIFLAEGTPVQNDEPKLSLHLQRWRHIQTPAIGISPLSKIKQDLKQILAELKIDYLEGY